MNVSARLISIKVLHTVIWIFFNVVIFYLLYAVITNQIDHWVWIGLGSFLAEGIVLLIFKNYCPLTLWARKYSSSTRDNFDIYIPNWLARYKQVDLYQSVGCGYFDTDLPAHSRLKDLLVKLQIINGFHPNAHVLLFQPFVQAFFVCITTDFNRFLAGGLAGNRGCRATHIHAGLLHGIYLVRESVFVRNLPINLKGSFGIIAYD